MDSVATTHRQFDLDHVARVYKIWGRYPALYVAQDWFSFMGRHRRIRQDAADALDLSTGARVLEIGCGTGRNFPYLQELVGRSGEVVGVDYTPEMLGAAQRLVDRRGWENVTLIEADATTLQLDDRFDAVLAVMSLSAMPHWTAALRRFPDLVRPGGRIVVADAREFPRRPLGVLNPLLRNVVAPLGAWHPWRDVPAQMERSFGNLSRTDYNFGTFYVATSIRSA